METSQGPLPNVTEPATISRCERVQVAQLQDAHERYRAATVTERFRPNKPLRYRRYARKSLVDLVN